MRSGWDRMWVGAVLGFVAPLLIFGVYYLRNIVSIRLFIKEMGDTLTAVMSLCVLANLGIFYLFLQKEFYKGARGVILATMLYAAAVFIVKLS